MGPKFRKNGEKRGGPEKGRIKENGGKNEEKGWGSKIWTSQEWTPRFQTRVNLWVQCQMWRFYVYSLIQFDLLSMLPLDLLYFIPSVKFNSMVRVPRMLKFHTYGDFFYVFDSMIKSAYALRFWNQAIEKLLCLNSLCCRIIKTLGYMVFIIHCNSCIYYLISIYQSPIGNEWVYNREGNA